jgi:hypothetical protein
MGTMATVPMDAGTVARCRELAGEVADDVQRYGCLPDGDVVRRPRELLLPHRAITIVATGTLSPRMGRTAHTPGEPVVTIPELRDLLTFRGHNCIER